MEHIIIYVKDCVAQINTQKATNDIMSCTSLQDSRFRGSGPKEEEPNVPATVGLRFEEVLHHLGYASPSDPTALQTP